jgi:hypothetical protein
MIARARVATAIIVVATLGAGCKDKSVPAPGSAATPSATEGSTKDKPGSPAAKTTPLLRLGAKGGNIYPHHLVARADGGFIAATEVRDQLTIGSVAVKHTGDDDMDTLIALDAAGKIRWVNQLGANCSGSVDVATHGTTTLIAGSCREPIVTASGKVALDRKDDYLHIVVASLDDAGNVTWGRYFGDAGGSQIVSSIASDAEGNVYVGGWLFAPVNFGTGRISIPKDSKKVAFVAAFDATGTTRWATSFPSASVDAILAAGDEVDIAMSFFKPLTLAGTKLEPTLGGKLVARLASKDGEPRAAVKVGENGANEQRLVRASSGTLYLSADDLDGVALYSIDSNNTVKELQRIASKDTCVVGTRDLAIDPSGSLFLGTCFNKPVDFGGGAVTAAGGGDAILVKYAADGTFVGQVPIATPQYDGHGGLALDKDGKPVYAWAGQAGPSDKPYEQWLITEVFYTMTVGRVAL